jgi:flagellar M-ring protein FliF
MSATTSGGIGTSLAGLPAALRALGPVRLAALAGTGLATLGLIGYLALRSAEPTMGLLYADLDQRDAGQVVQVLERAKVPHRLSRSGTEILVPEAEVGRLRLMLARDGLPSGGSVGYEIFDRQNGLTSTPFQQDMNRLRALEGEIARSIRTIQGVNAARVHLVLPRREPFSRERGEAQASVVLQMRGAQRLDREGVQAVLHLVAAAVPGLRPQNVAIVDGRGDLLARGGQAVGAGQNLAMTQDEARRAQEMRLSRGVEEMLERILGPGRVRAEATVELDHDRVQTTEERFDPDNQVPRSTQSTNESNRNGEAPNVSVANQLPGAPAQAQGGNQSSESRQEETTNFEIGRTTRSTTREHPTLRRVSIAVLVDGVSEVPPGGGAPRMRERTAEELARIATLVRGAVGYDERRGDRVEVVSMPFVEPNPGPEASSGGLMSFVTPASMTRLVETLLTALVALAALFLIGRPLASKIAASIVPRSDPALLPAGESLPALPAGQEDAFISMANIDGQLRASSVKALGDLVDAHPDEALGVVRNWLSHEEARP